MAGAAAIPSANETLDNFIRHGGVRRDSEVEQMLLKHTSQPLSRLAKWIVERRIVTVECAGQRWIPLFQFEFAAMTIRPGVAAAIAELASVMDDAELANWFAMPNALLGGYAPAQMASRGVMALLSAARADRFLLAS
jgi:hypothetical protein